MASLLAQFPTLQKSIAKANNSTARSNLKHAGKHAQLSAKPTSEKKEPASPKVVVFDATVGSKSEVTSRDRRSFMAADVKKITEEKPKQPITKEEEELDRQDDEHDRELMDLIKSSKLIEEYTASELTGKDRRSYLQKKMIELGAKKPNAPKAPFPMRLGMIKAEKERNVKKLQVAKDTGQYHASLRTQILAGDDIEKARKLKKKPGSRIGSESAGIKTLDGGIGRFKGGTLHIGKDAPSAVAKLGKVRPGGKNTGMGIRITGDSSGSPKSGGKKRKGRGSGGGKSKKRR